MHNNDQLKNEFIEHQTSSSEPADDGPVKKHIKLSGVSHVHWIFVLFVSFIVLESICKRTMCRKLSLPSHAHLVSVRQQAAYSELNYHHRNDYRDYQIKFSSLRLNVVVCVGGGGHWKKHWWTVGCDNESNDERRDEKKKKNEHGRAAPSARNYLSLRCLCLLGNNHKT